MMSDLYRLIETIGRTQSDITNFKASTSHFATGRNGSGRHTGVYCIYQAGDMAWANYVTVCDKFTTGRFHKLLKLGLSVRFQLQHRVTR
jgi:hypothetical protein